jgi:hypothetical protein
MIYMISLAVIFLLVGQLPLALSEESNAQERTLAYIENVVPLDTTKYDVTLSKYNADSAATTVSYKLRANESELEATCLFTGDVLTGCVVSVKQGAVLYSTQSVNFIDAAQSFLKKYQTYTGDDLSAMMTILADADATKNMTTTSGNLKLIVESNQFFTAFRWVNTINGADYTSLGIAYEKGFFSSMRDDRKLYDMDKTDVNISAEQAISAAMEYIQNYSYAGFSMSQEKPEPVQVSGFNVTEEKTIAELKTYPKDNSSTLFPYWRIQLSLDELYPGSVWALSVGVWADSGEVFLCQPLAISGPPGFDSSEPPALSEQDSSTASPTNLFLLVLAIAIISALAISALLIKKRNK